jgi:DUF4097 and DUF4098 domain-containing protein YvlB
MMNSQKFDLGKAPHLIVAKCDGDCVIRSWTELDVQIKGEEFTAVDNEGQLTITSQGSLRVMTPAEASVVIENASGDLIIKNVEGDVSLHDVHGDAVLIGTGQAKLQTIHGDLSVKNMDGGVSVETVHGDAVLRSVGEVNIALVNGDFSARFINGAANLGEVGGDMSVNTVNGDFVIKKGHRDANLRNLGGVAIVSEIAGDIRIMGGLTSGDHSFTAGGDIIVRWPTDAALNLTANAPKIVNRIALENVVESENSLPGIMGDGKTIVTLKANGRIILKDARVVRAEWDSFEADNVDFDFAFDFGGLSEEFTSKINEHVASITANLEEKFGPDFQERINDQMSRLGKELEGRFGPEFGERMAQKAERAAAKAEKAAERAIRRLEQQMQRTTQQQSRSRRWGPPAPPTPPKPKKSSAEEQLKILKMVENGTITPDEAATLLKALES